MVDADGFRPNVGIVVANDFGQVLWARRIGGHDAWQFPQGGIKEDETPEEALFRELHEEIGLDAALRADRCVHHRMVALPAAEAPAPVQLRARLQRPEAEMVPAADGRSDECVCVNGSVKPEFDDWRWVSYWYPVSQVVEFKRDVYRQALKELAPRLVVAARR